MDQRELAKRTGLSVKHINQVIKGVASITQDTAIRLERVTGVPARMWNSLEANCRERLARLDERSRLQGSLDWLKAIPATELVQRGKIREVPDPLRAEKEVWGAGQQQVRNIWSNLGCWHLNQWMYTFVELRCWDMDQSELTDRRNRSWDNPDRRPSHTDRRRSIAREMLQRQFPAALPGTPDDPKFRTLLEALLALAI